MASAFFGTRLRQRNEKVCSGGSPERSRARYRSVGYVRSSRVIAGTSASVAGRIEKDIDRYGEGGGPLSTPSTVNFQLALSLLRLLPPVPVRHLLHWQADTRAELPLRPPEGDERHRLNLIRDAEQPLDVPFVRAVQ